MILRIKCDHRREHSATRCLEGMRKAAYYGEGKRRILRKARNIGGGGGVWGGGGGGGGGWGWGGGGGGGGWGGVLGGGKGIGTFPKSQEKVATEEERQNDAHASREEESHRIVR